MRRRLGGLTSSPLPWMGGLLVLYLVVPVAAFAVHLAAAHQRGFGTPGLLGAVYVSVVTATISTAVIAVLGVPLAYALTRYRGRLATVVGVLVVLPLAMPPLMSGILLVELVGPYSLLGQAFGRHLTESMAGVIIAQTFVASPFLVVAARSAFGSVEPAVVEHAATLGHREASRFLRVYLPVARSGISAGLVLAWLRAFGEYGATVILSYHPYTLPVFTYVQFTETGVPATRAPTAIGLGVAVAVAFLGRARLRRRRPRATALPPPVPPPPHLRRPPLAWALDARLGTFRLRVAYEARATTVAVLGPSGSGKSATLRGLAGLLGPGAGTVRFGERCMDGVATEDRRLGYVPQGYGLLPHLTVWRQVTFGIGSDPGHAAYWLEHLGLGGLERRFPDELSGGQRQRVSLAQALARAPDVLLLDEPLSALDSPVRLELRRQLRRLQRETGLPTVIVTHDPEEAAYLAEEVVVLEAGRVLQAGSRQDVFTTPISGEVGRLVGVRNLLAGRVLGPGTVETRVPGTAGPGSAGPGTAVQMETGDLPPGTLVLWTIAPEEVALDGSGAYRGVVLDDADLGTRREALLELAPGVELVATVPGRSGLVVGEEHPVGLPSPCIRVWPVSGAAGPAR